MNTTYTGVQYPDIYPGPQALQLFTLGGENQSDVLGIIAGNKAMEYIEGL